MLGKFLLFILGVRKSLLKLLDFSLDLIELLLFHSQFCLKGGGGGGASFLYWCRRTRVECGVIQWWVKIAQLRKESDEPELRQGQHSRF